MKPLAATKSWQEATHKQDVDARELGAKIKRISLAFPVGANVLRAPQRATQSMRAWSCGMPQDPFDRGWHA